MRRATSSCFMFTRSISRGLPKLIVKAIISYDNASLHKEIIFKEYEYYTTLFILFDKSFFL